MKVPSDYAWDAAESADFVHGPDAITGHEAFQAAKRQSYAWQGIALGQRILDVGCGAGDDVRAIAQLVGASGQVVGIDSSEGMINEARKRSEGLNLPVSFRVGDATRLDFAAGTFDGCRADRVFQHLEDREQALAEMIRVARSDARVVVFDPDWDTLVVDMPDKHLTRQILEFHCDRVRNGWCGRQLYGLFKQAGLQDIRVVPVTIMFADHALANQILELGSAVDDLQRAGAISSADAEAWLGQWEQAGLAGNFFSAMTFFGVSGRKP